MSRTDGDPALDAQIHGLERVVDALRRRGIEAGEQQAEARLEQARAEARTLIDEARVEAERVVAAAEAEANRRTAQLEHELAQASAAGLLAFRQALERSVVVPTIDGALAGVLEDPAQLGAMLREAVRAFAHGGGDLEVLLPAAERARLDGAFVEAVVRDLDEGVTVRFDADVRAGLRLRGDGLELDVTDDALREVLLRFASPRLRAQLFAAGGEG
ncbi:MAG: hypothetical protein AAF799_00395 [Myxococcota bacterium]